MLIILHYQHSLKCLESPNKKNWIIGLENTWPCSEVTPSALQFEASCVRNDPGFMCRTLKQKRIHPDRKTDIPPIRLEMGGVEEPSHLLTLNSQTQREKSSRFCLETPRTPSERWSCIVLFFFHILYRWYFLFLSYVLYTMYTFI